MLPQKIATVADLQTFLKAAMQLEHATIPPYLMALYSIKPGSNSDASHVLRVVVVEEMLHLTLAANLLNAVGGQPDLTARDFVPVYPAHLPDGEADFEVGVEPFSRRAVETFLQIERPDKPSGKGLTRRARRATTQLGLTSHEQGFYSIGDFYEEIRRGLRQLHKEMGDALFCGDRRRQISREYYYSGGGEIHEVHDIASAMAAIGLIVEQGEGIGGGIFEHGRTHELAHYYRFEQLKLGKYYQPGDAPGHPSGPSLVVDWDAAYRFKTNVRLDDYPADSELHAAAVDFHQAYQAFLGLLTRAFGGQPELLIEAVPQMFKLRYKIERLIHNPMPGHAGLNAAPAFGNPQAAAVAP